MKDRLRDLFKTSLGKYVSPQKIELLLGQDPFIEQIITVGDNRKYITALIVPTMASLKVHAREMGLEYASEKELASHPEIYTFIEKRINYLQIELAPFEQIKKFKLLPEPFTIENEGMTSTLKLKRKNIVNQYKELIEEMY
jgi:long-chain acyl-CoA synthetase